MLAHLLLGWFLWAPQAGTLPDTNPLAMSPEMRAFLDTRVDRGLPPYQRLEALVSAVFQDPQLNFSYSTETQTATETFHSRNGNCLSFTILFIAMARHLNLDARFREVEIAPTWSKAGSFVNLAQHVNAAVFIGGLAYAIDVYPGVNPLEIGGQVVADARGIAHYFNNKGVDELGYGNFAGAEMYLKKALELDPETVPVWINLGAAKNQAGKLGEAEKYYRKAIELDPRSSAAMSNLANLCDLTGRTKEAAGYRKKIRQFLEKNPYHHYNLGMQAYEAGRYQEAIARFKKALRLKSEEHNFYFAMARAYAQLDNSEEAVNNLKLAEKYAADPANKQRYAQKLELLKSIKSPASIGSRQLEDHPQRLPPAR